MVVYSLFWAIWWIAAKAGPFAVMLLDQFYRLSRVFRAIVRDRLGNTTVLTLCHGSGQIGYAAVRRAQDQG